MSILHSIVYGAVQGLTEFLPVSSSAHLVLIPFFTGWEDPGLAFDVALHWGTLLAVVLYFRTDVATLVRDAFRFIGGKRSPETQIPIKIAVATIPGAVLGLLLEKHAESHFRSPALLTVTLSLMGIGLWAADRWGKKNRPINNMSWPQTLAIGVAQGLALIPGVSRSGITITSGLLLGLRRDDAVRFSFLLSMPITFGAGLLKSKFLLTNIGDSSVWIALGSSFLFGIAAIHVLITYVKNKSFVPFVVYRLGLAAFVAIWLFTN